MSRLSTVSIKNFKLLKDVEINLANLNLLTGINSSGKSSFIQALLLLMQNKEMLRAIELFKLSEQNESVASKELSEIISFITAKGISFNGLLMKLGDASSLLNQDAYGENIKIKISTEKGYGEISINSFDLSIQAEFDVNQRKKHDITMFRGAMASLENAQYFHTDRIQPQSIYDLSVARVNEGRLGIHGEFTAHYLDDNRRKDIPINKLKHPDAKTNQLLENVSCWLGEISAGVLVNVKKFSEIQKASLTFQYAYSSTTSNEYAPMNVGFGLTYVLPIVVALLKAQPGEIIIIENPESHLHPKAQVKIAQLCALAAENEVQLIIESHSDHFLNGLRVAAKKNCIAPEKLKLFYFSKNEYSLCADVVELSVDGNGRIKEDWPAGFFDEYGKQMDELLW